MARYNLTFNLQTTPGDDLVSAVAAALEGDFQPTLDAGGSVERVLGPVEALGAPTADRTGEGR